VRVGAILRAPSAYFRDWTPPTAPVTPKAGIRPMTPDGLPVVGRLGNLSNTYVSSGHGMQGITLGPGSALALSRMVLHGEVPDVLVPFAPQRFTRALVRKNPTRRDLAADAA
jgi:D-amino-acid dehydrogenase